jgi:hypothetical protein
MFSFNQRVGASRGLHFHCYADVGRMALIATFLKYMNAATGHACYGTPHLLLALERANIGRH